MSNSQFDPDIEVTPVKDDAGELVVPRKEYKVKGNLSEEVDKYGEYLRVLVSVWQTEEDTKEGGKPNVLIAHALGVGERNGRERWSAELTIVDGLQFKPGQATGMAHAVGNNGVPGGFETYTWTKRLQVEDP